MRGYVIECCEELPDYVWAAAPEIRENYPIPTALRFYRRTLEKLTKEETP